MLINTVDTAHNFQTQHTLTVNGWYVKLDGLLKMYMGVDWFHITSENFGMFLVDTLVDIYRLNKDRKGRYSIFQNYCRNNYLIVYIKSA